MMRVDLDELVSVHEIAEWYGVNGTAVSNWQKRYPDFPQPVGAWSKGRFKLWRLSDIDAWAGSEEVVRRPRRHARGPR